MAGARALFAGWGFLLRTPRSWPYALLPALILGLLLGLVGWSTTSLLFPRILASLPRASAGLEHALWLGASGVLTAGVLVLGVSLALALTPPLSSPALEALVSLQEAGMGIPKRQRQSWWSEIWCGFRAQVFVWIFVAPALAALWLLELLVPALLMITTPLKLIVTSFALAWNLLDYPLTLRGVRMRERLLLFRRFKATCLGFGASFAVLFWIPCGCQVVLLPVGAAAATRLVWELLVHAPDLLPALPRPTPTEQLRSRPNAAVRG